MHVDRSLILNFKFSFDMVMNLEVSSSLIKRITHLLWLYVFGYLHTFIYFCSTLISFIVLFIWQSYQLLCEKHPSFRERSENVDLVVEISLQPWKVFRPDGVRYFARVDTPLLIKMCSLTHFTIENGGKSAIWQL